MTGPRMETQSPLNLIRNLGHQCRIPAKAISVCRIRRAEESLTVSVTKDIGEHSVGLSVLASGDREDFGGVVLDSYVLANLTGQIAFGDRWRMNARIENLLDEEYETAAGFPMQERSGFLEVRYSWE